MSTVNAEYVCRSALQSIFPDINGCSPTSHSFHFSVVSLNTKIKFLTQWNFIFHSHHCRRALIRFYSRIFPPPPANHILLCSHSVCLHSLDCLPVYQFREKSARQNRIDATANKKLFIVNSELNTRARPRVYFMTILFHQFVHLRFCRRILGVTRTLNRYSWID